MTRVLLCVLAVAAVVGAPALAQTSTALTETQGEALMGLARAIWNDPSYRPHFAAAVSFALGFAGYAAWRMFLELDPKRVAERKRNEA